MSKLIDKVKEKHCRKTRYRCERVAWLEQELYDFAGDLGLAMGLLIENNLLDEFYKRKTMVEESLKKQN